MAWSRERDFVVSVLLTGGDESLGSGPAAPYRNGYRGPSPGVWYPPSACKPWLAFGDIEGPGACNDRDLRMFDAAIGASLAGSYAVRSPGVGGAPAAPRGAGLGGPNRT